MAALENELCKMEPMDFPLKKSKLDEYAAYLYAATIDPLYIHAAMYEQWSQRPPLSAFRPVQNIYPTVTSKEKSHRHHQHHHHSHHHHKYKESPPVLQHPERVVPLSESERFERTYQPNVALAPPTTISNRTLKTIKVEDNADTLPQPQPQTPLQLQSQPQSQTHVNEPTNLVPPKLKEEEPLTRSSIVDSTVSVVQSIGNVSVPQINNSAPSTQRYNSEIELSTDTDDSLSDMSTAAFTATSVNIISGDELQHVLDILVDVSREVKDRVIEIVRRLVGEHSKAIKHIHYQDAKIADLEQRIVDLETSGIGKSEATLPAEYDITVTSSRTEPTIHDGHDGQDGQEDSNTEELSVTTQNDSPPVVTSCLSEGNTRISSPTDEDQNDDQNNQNDQQHQQSDKNESNDEPLKKVSAEVVNNMVISNVSPNEDSEVINKETIE